MVPYPESDLQIFSVPSGSEDHAWTGIRKACPDLTDWGVERLRAGVEGYAQTVVVEPHYICRDFRDLYSRFYSKKFVQRSSRCHRIHFFSKSDLSENDILFSPEHCKEAYIGYCVVQPIRKHCLGRTMIDPRKIGWPDDSFWCLRTPTKVHIAGAEYEVKAFPWTSQSREATVCAHAALWGICRYLSDRYSIYSEVHPYDLIEMTGTAKGRKVPYRGMTYEDYCGILSTFGCYPVPRAAKGTDQTDWTQDRTFFYDLYAYVESGFPVLVSFGGHAVSVVGHTLDTSRPIQEFRDGNFYNSFCYVKQFVAMDDNFFPYQLLGFNDDVDNYGKIFSSVLPHGASIEAICAMIVPLPEKAFLPADIARSLCYKRFGDPDATKLIKATLEDGLGLDKRTQLVARMFLTSSISFKARKRLCVTGDIGPLPDVLASAPIDLSLPHFVWVMELAPEESYSRGNCIAEVVLDASESEDECKYIYTRIGRHVTRDGRTASSENAPREFCQYTHNLGERGT